MGRVPRDEHPAVTRAIDPEGDDPPGAVQVDRPHERRRNPVEDPVLDSRAVSGALQQVRRVEHHPEVGSQRMLADVVGANGGAHRAAGAVTADDVRGGDHRPVARVVDHGDLHRVIVLIETSHPPTGGQRHRGQLVHDIAQQFLQHVLGSLLTGLGGPAVLRGEPEHAAEARQLVADQRRVEDDVLRPRHGQRRALAQPVGDAPAAQVLHRADADRLTARPGV